MGLLSSTDWDLIPFGSLQGSLRWERVCYTRRFLVRAAYRRLERRACYSVLGTVALWEMLDQWIRGKNLMPPLHHGIALLSINVALTLVNASAIIWEAHLGGFLADVLCGLLTWRRPFSSRWTLDKAPTQLCTRSLRSSIGFWKDANLPCSISECWAFVDAAEKDSYKMLAELILLGMYTSCRINNCFV